MNDTITKDEKDKLYKEKRKDINYLIKYYLDLQDYLEESNLKRPDYYLLLINISKFNTIINISFDYLEKWYKEENISCNISLVNKLVNMYRSGQSFHLNELNRNELLLFYSEIAIPNKLFLKRDICNNISSIKNNINYLNKTISYILEKQEKNQ